MADTFLTPEEQKFFETGELQPGMVPEPPPEPEPPAQQAAAPEPPASAQPPAVPDQQHQPSSEATEILRRSLAEAQQRVGALEAYIQQATQQPQQPSTPAPDPTTDPLGAMMHQLEQVNKTVADLQAALTQQQTHQTQLTQFQQFQQRVGQLRDEFVKATPDFPDAYKHIRDARIADLRTFGLTDDKIQQALFQEEATLAEQAIRNGKNPAEVLYEMARRHGYAPKAAAPATPTNPNDKLASIRQAQTASKQLPSTPNQEDLSVEGLKEASDSDLNKIVMDEKLWSRIVGSDQYPL